MIQYSLVCARRHTFDAWFKNAQAFEEQAQSGVLTCPVCDSPDVEKALMAPSLARGEGDTAPTPIDPADRKSVIKAVRALREKMLSGSDYVGPRFAAEARKMAFGEIDPRTIHGEASREEAESLIADGVGVVPLPNLPEDQN